MKKFVLTVFVGVMITGHSLFAMCEEDQNEGMTVRKIQEAIENKKKTVSWIKEKITDLQPQNTMTFSEENGETFKLFLHDKRDEFTSLGPEHNSKEVCGTPSRTERKGSWDFLYFFDPKDKTYTDGIGSTGKLKCIMHMHIKQIGKN